MGGLGSCCPFGVGIIWDRPVGLTVSGSHRLCRSGLLPEERAAHAVLPCAFISSELGVWRQYVLALVVGKWSLVSTRVREAASTQEVV
jgi:hypothetical protein